MPIRFEAWQICNWVHPGSSCHGCQSVVEATMRSSTNVSLYRIAHCNLLRSELVCLIQTGPLSDHAIIQSAAVCTKSLARGPVRAIDPRTTLKNCSHCRINLRRAEFQRMDPHPVREISENQPELLARHCTEAGQIEKAAALWGKAGLRSAQRSALVEAAEQLRRSLDQIATLTPTSALRREEIKLQVALITPLLHVRGYAAPETRAAVERARLLIEQAEALGEPPEDNRARCWHARRGAVPRACVPLPAGLCEPGRAAARR
jgi:hypothetical protein